MNILHYIQVIDKKIYKRISYLQPYLNYILRLVLKSKGQL